MSVNSKDRAALQELWEQTEAASGFKNSDIPDGDYEFEITKVEPNLKKFGLRITYKVTGGDESQIGNEITVQDNLDSAMNMGWFKRRLKSLRIDFTKYSDFDQLLASSDEEGSVGSAMVGKKFHGLKKNKNGYDAVYVNKPIDGDDSAEEPEAEAEAPRAKTKATKTAVAEEAEETTDETPAEDAGIIAGTRVTFTSKVDGEQVGAVNEQGVFQGEKGEDRVRVIADSNNKTYNLPITAVTIEEVAAEEAVEDSVEATEEVEEVEVPVAKAKAPAPKSITNGATVKKATKKAPVPAPKDIKTLRMPDIKTFLATYGIKADALAKPREFLSGVSGFVHSKTYTPDLTELNALCLGLAIKKGAKPADTVKVARQKVLATFA